MNNINSNAELKYEAPRTRYVLAIAAPREEAACWIRVSRLFPSIGIYLFEFDVNNDLNLHDCTPADFDSKPLFIGIACIFPSNLKQLVRLKAENQYFSIFANARVLDPIGSEDETDIAGSLIAALVGFLSPAASFGADQALALAALRLEYERVHLRFSELEQFMQRAGIGLVREERYVEPVTAADGSFLSADVSAGHFSQLLPVASKGLCALSIKLTNGERASRTQMSVDLVLGDDAGPKVKWVIDPESFPPVSDGWITLTLPRALDGVARRATLHFHTESSLPGDVSLALGRVIANDAYRLRDCSSGKAIASRPIAMRLWEAPPGCEVPRIRGGLVLTDSTDKGSSGAVRVNPTALQSARPVPGLFAADRAPPVRLSPSGEGVSVSAMQHVGAAVIDRLVARETVWVSAVAEIEDDPATDTAPIGRVRVAVGLADPVRIEGRRFRAADVPSHLVAWSGWSTLESRSRHQLSIAPPSSGVEGGLPLSLLFLTQRPELTGDDLRVRFSDVQLDRF